MAVLQSPNVALKQPIAVHGDATDAQHLHAIVTVPAGNLTTGDSYQFGYLPPNAVVTGAVLKAATQLDSNGSPTLALNLGVTGTLSLFKAAVTTVGRAAGASADNTVAAAGYLYKNTTGAKILVTGAHSTGAATGVAGTLELSVSYFVEE